MQTSPVANPMNAAMPPASTKSQANAADNDAPAFGQVLSREIAERQDVRPTDKASEAQAGKPAGKQEQSATKSADDKTEATDAAEATDAQASADSQAAGVSADMLALVNSLNLANLRPANTADANDASIGKGKRTDALSSASDKLSNLTNLSDKGIAADESGTRGKPDVMQAATSIAAAAESATDGRSALIKPDTHFADQLQQTLSNAPTGLHALQQAASAAQPALSQVAEHLAPRVGTPAWDQALGQRVVWMVNGDQQTASLTLNPPDLGPLQVVLNVSNSHADATFTAAQPEVRQALEAALPKLRDMLSEAGIQLGQANVNSGTPQSRGEAEQQRARATGTGERGDSSAGLGDGGRVGAVKASAVGRGLVDTFV